MNYYNDNDPKVCAWTEELIRAGLIPAGDVVCKSITDIQPDELKNYTQVHLFNGISGWAYAAKLAGWPTTRPIWFASCPCQPFSSAGQQKGITDERDLWPHLFRLIKACKPVTVMGEQVSSAIGHGWLDRICDDCEGEGYTIGAAVLGAGAVGAPHIRQRLYWVAESRCERGEWRPKHCGCGSGSCAEQGAVVECGCDGGVAHTGGQRADILPKKVRSRNGSAGESGGDGRLANPVQRGQRGGDERGLGTPGREMGEHQDGPGAANQPRHGCQDAEWMGEPEQPRLEGHAGDGDGRREPGRLDTGTARPVAETSRDGGGRMENTGHDAGCAVQGDERGECDPRTRQPGAWDNAIWLPCRDGKARRVKPGLPLLFARVSDRVVRKRGDRQPEIVAERCGEAAVMRLRGYGNSIVPQVAAEFIKAYLNQ